MVSNQSAGANDGRTVRNLDEFALNGVHDSFQAIVSA